MYYKWGNINQILYGWDTNSLLEATHLPQILQLYNALKHI